MGQKRHLNRLSTRQRAEKMGRRAEMIAELWLRLKGYSILASRFRCQAGEIDIIARRGKLLIFVEVKARPTHEAAIWAVTPNAEQRISKAASIWASQNHKACADLNWRYDVMTFARRSLKHHRDAWRPSVSQQSVNQGDFF